MAKSYLLGSAALEFDFKKEKKKKGKTKQTEPNFNKEDV